MNSAREAILTAADTIEQRPELWDFFEAGIPRRDDGGEVGCALGWIGYHLENAAIRGKSIIRMYEPLGLRHDIQFYTRLEYIYMNSTLDYECVRLSCMPARDLARCLRIYADTYHKRTGIPQSVRQVFATPVCASFAAVAA